MDSVFQEAIDATLLPHRIERMARGATIRTILDNWLLLTNDDPEGAYAEVLRFKGLDAWVEMKLRILSRHHSKASKALQDTLACAETRVAGLIYGIPDDAEKHPEWKSNCHAAS